MYIRRFTSKVESVLQLLKEKSIEADVPVSPTTGHLVLALMDYRSGFAAQILSRFGLEYSKIRQVEKLVQAEDSAGAPVLPSELDDVLCMAGYYAESLRSHEIDTEHILMGMFLRTQPVDNGLLLIVDPEIDRLGAKIIRSFEIKASDIDTEVRKLTRPVKQLFNLN